LVCFQTAELRAEVPVSAAEAFRRSEGGKSGTVQLCRGGFVAKVVFQDESLEIDISLIIGC